MKRALSIINCIACLSAPIIYVAFLVYCTRQSAATYQSQHSLLTAEVAANPDSHVAWCGLGIEAYNVQQLTEAKRCFAEALRIKPNYPEAKKALELTEFQLAARNQEAVSSGEADFRLGSMLMGRGNLDDAAAAFERSLLAAPDVPETHFNLGNAHARLGRTAKAVEEYREAVRLRPDYQRAWANLAGDCAALGLRDEAIRAAERARDLAREQGKPDAAKQLDDWLERYRSLP